MIEFQDHLGVTQDGRYRIQQIMPIGSVVAGNNIEPIEGKEKRINVLGKFTFRGVSQCLELGRCYLAELNNGI